MISTGLYDKNGREIRLGDIIEIHTPYRSTQTHYGENIPGPTGEYTEPLEPEIKTSRFTVKWGKGMFYINDSGLDGEDMLVPLSWELGLYKSRDDLIDAFGGLSNWLDEDNPGEDDLGYLLEQYPPSSEEELMHYISGCEIIEP